LIWWINFSKRMGTIHFVDPLAGRQNPLIDGIGRKRQAKEVGDADDLAQKHVLAEMNPAQLDALDAGYTYSLLWIAAVAVLVGGSALFIGYSSSQIAAAQHTREAVEAGEL
jgi:hypothetical protein